MIGGVEEQLMKQLKTLIYRRNSGLRSLALVGGLAASAAFFAMNGIAAGESEPARSGHDRTSASTT